MIGLTSRSRSRIRRARSVGRPRGTGRPLGRSRSTDRLRRRSRGRSTAARSARDESAGDRGHCTLRRVTQRRIGRSGRRAGYSRITRTRLLGCGLRGFTVRCCSWTTCPDAPAGHPRLSILVLLLSLKEPSGFVGPSPLNIGWGRDCGCHTPRSRYHLSRSRHDGLSLRSR